MRIQGMDQISFFFDASNQEAIKFGAMPTIRTLYLVMASCEKLPRPSFISYVSNISLCEARF